jgi:hypothetical protein
MGTTEVPESSKSGLAHRFLLDRNTGLEETHQYNKNTSAVPRRQYYGTYGNILRETTNLTIVP